MKDTPIRNVAIIAHVDHGKTTLVDGLLKQSNTFRENEIHMTENLILDSNDQERERGITILAKNTSINYKNYKINIIDTPGHADFGGEVERTLNMAEGAILIVDAQEGPMPQTKFVLKKALEIGLKIIVLINKIDKNNADIEKTISKTNDLFLELATHEDQLDFPVYYAIGREGKAWNEMPSDLSGSANLEPIFEAIIDYVPAPVKDDDGPFQMLISALGYDNFMGKYAIGKIKRGKIKSGDSIVLIDDKGLIETGKAEKILQDNGLKKIEVDVAYSGDIINLAGIHKAMIGKTLSDPKHLEALPTINIEEPTLSISIYANTSPFAGREGQFVTARQIIDRIKKELETNVSMSLEMPTDGSFVLSGRGELHLSVFIETLRREGYELQVGKPKVITKEINGVIHEPIEELTVDVEDEYTNVVIREVNYRKGILQSQDPNTDGTTRIVFEIPTRGTLGLRNALLTATKGNAIVNSVFLKHAPQGNAINKLRLGAMIAYETGKAVTYGLNAAQQRGITFIPPQTDVYAGMIVGLNCKYEDIEINVTKEKKLTNMRASSSDITIPLTPPTILSLEQCIDFLEDDEYLEVTPKALRLRKKILNSHERAKQKKLSNFA